MIATLTIASVVWSMVAVALLASAIATIGLCQAAARGDRPVPRPAALGNTPIYDELAVEFFDADLDEWLAELNEGRA